MIFKGNRWTFLKKERFLLSTRVSFASFRVMREFRRNDLTSTMRNAMKRRCDFDVRYHEFVRACLVIIENAMISQSLKLCS